MNLWNFVIILVLSNLSTSQYYDDQPKILVHDGNLILESAQSKDVSVNLRGKSRFYVNNIDILSSLNPSNVTNSNSPNDISSQAIANLEAEFNKLKVIVRRQNLRIENLENSGNGTYNVSIPADRLSIGRLRRRVQILEQRVANLTERLTKDYCRNYPCQNGGTCFNVFNTYRCECPENWEGPQCANDVNECGKYAGTDLGCQNGATCINTLGSYECSCMDGWKGKNCNRRKVDCMSVPQMEICGHGSCIPDNNKDGYSCICMQGWRKDNNSQSCTQDVDECLEMRPHCSVDPPVLCINTPGSFVCGPCPQGYTGNGFYCTDINECEENNGGCSTSPKVQCINTRGSFRCGSCPLGFLGDGKICSPSNQPISPNQCDDGSICNPNALCYQYPNSGPTCLCKPGYTGNGFGENGCVQHAIDPCNQLRCRNGGACIRNGTSAYCSCPAGTNPPLCDRMTNSCEPNPCMNGGNCTASRFSNSFRCACPRGFSGNRCQNQQSTCGGVLNTFNGTLRYPTDPKASSYNHNSRCAWLIKTNHTKVLNITFQSFHVELSTECRYDWLQIHDGRSAASHLIGRFCGQNLPKGGNIISTHNQVYLWFRSDNSTAHSGFELSWESIDPVCGYEKNITSHGIIFSPGSPGNYPVNRDCEWILFATPGKRIQFLFYTLMIESHATCGYDYLEIHSGVGIDSPSLGKYCNSTIPAPILTPGNIATVHFHSDGDSSDAGFQIAYSVVEGIPGCGGTYTAAKGDISSPIDIATGNYKNSMMCDYVIQMPVGTRIRIEFKKFNLEESSTCKFDKLEIFEGPENDEEGLIGRYCGVQMPPIIISQTNIVTIRFSTDWSQAEEGFHLQYRLICGGIFTADSGILSSPNYPNNYDGDRNCEYDIIAPQGKVIVLNILDFDIEQHSTCEFDYLQIFDSSTADNATSLGKYCGEKKPGIFTSTYNQLHIEFSCDSSVFGRGFQANYTFLDIECGGLIKDSKEVVKPPMDIDGNGVYKSNAICRWLVNAPEGFVIQMNIINFDLEHDSNCKYDYLKIFNNGSGNGDQIGPFCGTNAPKVITTVDNLATIVFASDSSTAKDGFTITFNFIDSSRLCGGNFYTRRGVIKSPGQPNYMANKICEWTITAPNGFQIEAKFNYFEMEAHETCKFDGLEIRNGGNKLAPLVGKFCGETIPPSFKSMSNQLFIRFYSDSSRNGKGFEIEWDATTFGCGGIMTNSKGAIQSSNYPIEYPHNAQCEWRISVNEGSSIQLVFSDLDMEQHSDCKYDYLEIFDGSDASAKSFGRFCSSEQHPIHIETSGNHAMIRMNTDESHSGRGFHIKYSANCNRTIAADTGIIESLNFPQDYPNNLDCAWTIKVSKGNRINMQFSHFNLENDNIFHNETNEHICKYDYLTIYDYDYETKEKKVETSKTFCNKAPEIRNSTTDAVVVIFHTDQATVNKGFRLEWYNEGCGGKLTHPSGSLTSPNYPRKYNHEITCIWEISVEYGYNIKLTVQELEMEKSPSCDFDSLIIAHDISFNNSITKICETIRQPTIITVDGHQVFVKFESDESHNEKGFNITYESVVSDCGGIFVAPNGVIQTPSYPTKNYDLNKTCEWKIQADNAYRLTFQLTDFDLEASVNCTKDSLEIYDPIFDELLFKGCGSQMPNVTQFTSKRNELVVRLTSDATINAKGFIGNFSVNCGSRIITNDTGEIIYRPSGEPLDCYWTIIADDPSKHVTLTFTYSRIFFDMDMECFSRVHVYEGDVDSLGPERVKFCGSKVPPAIISHGNSLTIYLNTTSMSSLSEFDIHYSVLDNACGGIYKNSIQGEFASPNYPESSPLNAYCEWTLSASAGNLLTLEIKDLKMATSQDCNENYLEIREINTNGALVGLFCGNEAPKSLESSPGYWIKYKTGATASNNGFLAKFKYMTHSNLEGASGVIESPNYPYMQRGLISYTYRISVRQGYVIRIEFKDFYMNEDDPEDCMSYLKFFNGYDDTAPSLTDEICYEYSDALISEANVVYLELHHSAFGKSRFRFEWNQVEKNASAENVTMDGCGKEVVSLNNANEFINITSPGYPRGYNSNVDCEWTFISGLSSYHPVIQFIDVDLEDSVDCNGDYVKLSASRAENSWKETGKLCQMDIRERKTFHGSPDIKLEFHSDFSQNETGFLAVAFLYCGNVLTKPDGIIEYDTMKNPGLRTQNCMWNITVNRGRRIKFEFLELNIRNVSGVCENYVMIKNGHDDSAPYLGTGQYCSNKNEEIPLTSGNQAFIKYKTTTPYRSTFKLRYSEVQHECGGQVTLSSSYTSSIINSPNYPNIPHPHIECTWIIIAPIGEEIRIDFIDRFDLMSGSPCDKEFVELREGSTMAASMIGSFCGNSKPPTKYTKSNVLRVKFFTDISEPKNGFKANVSIGVCGGTIATTDIGYLASPKYPGTGAYPSNSTCDYRIVGPPNNLFTIKILDLDLPYDVDEFDSNENINMTCNMKMDHFKLYSVVPDGNSSDGENLLEIGTYCGNIIPTDSIMSDSNEILVRFKTFQKTPKLYKGFRLFYNTSKLSCGGEINADSGFITSVGYPSRTLSRTFCEWRITVRKGKRVKLEFIDIDLISTTNRFAQRIGVYNDFHYSNRMIFVTNSTNPGVLYSSDNRIMITSWIRITSQNRGFKIKFSSDEDTVCFGDLNQREGSIYPPSELNTISYSCSYHRTDQAIIPSSPNTGTLAYYFSDLSVGRKISNCQYAATVINVIRESVAKESDKYLGRICGNASKSMSILSPFPDVKIEVKQSPFFGKINFNLSYKTHRCGGIFKSGFQIIKNPPENTADYAILDCAWYLKYDEGFSVTLTVNKLNLKLPCDQEYVTIYNGPTATSPTLIKLCGNEFNNDQLLSQRESVFIEYHTDNFNGVSKNSEFEIKASTSSFGCGGILNQYINKFSTPLYDKPYPPNTECVWEIRADIGFSVGLKFTGRFFIEESPNCTKDYIEIHDYIDNEWKFMKRICGRDTPKPINSTYTRLKVTFHSDETISGDGFNAEWDEICGGLISVDKNERFLTSPKYPRNYPPGLFCNYTFVSSIPNAFINLNFLDFEIESASGKCIYDNLTITRMTEIGLDYGKIGTFCGSNKPGSFRYKESITLIFRTDKWIERKGFNIKYNLDTCGGVIKNSTVISSPKNLRSNIRSAWEYLGSLTCFWNITAPSDKKIVIKFEKLDLDYTEVCSYDYVEIYNGKVDNETERLTKLCGNITVPPIVINNNEAVIKLQTDQVRDTAGLKASILFQQKCDETIKLTTSNPSHLIDKSNQQNANNLECVFKITGEPLSVLKLTFTEIHLSICDPDKPHANMSQTDWKCHCDYVEILNGNGPFSESIGRYCGHDVPDAVMTTTSAAYVRFVSDSIRSSTGFKLSIDMIESPCGSRPYHNFSSNFNETFVIESPKASNMQKYPSNIRCEWTIEAPIRQNFEISFSRFELEDSENCSKDSLRIEDNMVSTYILEGLGQEVIYNGKSTYTFNPSFYMGMTGPNAPHIYCGTVIPHVYYSLSEKVRIMFTSNSENEYNGFSLTVKPISICSRTFTELQGRLISDNNRESCRATIKVPDDYTISLFFYRFMFYQSDCEKAFMKVYDGDFDNGALLKTLCGYSTPNPIFSSGNQLSIYIEFEKESAQYLRGSYDILYVASKKIKGPGCGGEIFNYGGLFSSPLYPSNNRSNFDCTWTVSVPQNLKIAVKFAVFDMGSKLTCENDYVEILEENEAKEFTSIKSYCGDDKPAIFIGRRNKIQVHYKQSVHFSGTGWLINFMGIHEGATPSEW